MGYASALLAQGNHADARLALKEAEGIFRSRLGENHPDYAIARYHLAVTLAASGEIDAAAKMAKEACDVLDVSRRRHGFEGVETPAAAAAPYLFLARLELQRENAEAAWAAVERACIALMLNMLEAPAFRELSPKELRRERELDGHLTELEAAATSLIAVEVSADGERADSIMAGLYNARERWCDFQAAMKGKYPSTEGRAGDLSDVQVQLDSASVVLGWLEADSKQFAYVIKPSGPVVWTDLPALNDSSTVADFESMLSGRKGDARSTRELAKAVYASRFQPFQSEIAQAVRLYVIPSGEMSAVPIEALYIDDYTTVADLWEVSYLPCASALTWHRSKAKSGRRGSLLALGDPAFVRAGASGPAPDRGVNDLNKLPISNAHDAIARKVEADSAAHARRRGAAAGEPADIAQLPRLLPTRREVTEVAGVFQSSTVLLGAEAGEDRLHALADHDELANYRYIHLATYTFADGKRAGRSSLVLSQEFHQDLLGRVARGERVFDGRLTMAEVMEEWRLGADLVTLSVCGNLSGLEESQGHLGLGSALMRAGAQSVLVGLWDVDPEARRLLMTRFYRNMIDGKPCKSAALREAKIWLRDWTTTRGATPFAHPHSWAGFVLIGSTD
jgi:CHAT domain-containing protein